MIGVRSSWLTSVRKSFWSANAVSSRSSMPLKVRPSSAISSPPRTGIRPDRSVSEIVLAVRVSACSGAIARPAASQMNSDASSITTIETPMAICTALDDLRALGGRQRRGDEDAAGVADGHRDRDVAGLAEGRVARRRSSGASIAARLSNAVGELAIVGVGDLGVGASAVDERDQGAVGGGVVLAQVGVEELGDAR